MKITWPGLPSNSEIEEVLQSGDAGLAVLSALLPEQGLRECQVSMGFLASYKLDRVMNQIMAVVSDHLVKPNCRATGVLLFSEAPPDILKPFLESVLVLDPAEGVRQKSLDVLFYIKEKEIKEAK